MTGGARTLRAAAVAACLPPLVMAFLAASPARLSWQETWSGLVSGPLPDADPQGIVRNIALPGALTALLAGLALGLSGGQMQGLFRNPLAGPDLLGVTAGASLGVAAAVLGNRGEPAQFLPGGGWGEWAAVGAAGFGAACALALALALAGAAHEPFSVLIAGAMLNALAGSLLSLLIYTAAPERLVAFMMWSQGNFRDGSWERLGPFAATTFAAMLVAAATAKPLNALQAGDDEARALGVRIRPMRWAILASASALAAAVTTFCGPVAFLGLAAPPLARGLLRTADQRWLLPTSAFVGAALALAIAVVARAAGGLPVNALAGLIGAPIVLVVALRTRLR